MLLKITFGKEIHLYNGDLCLQTIIDFAKKAFKALPKHFRFTYVDQQGDRIMLATSEELEMSYSYHTGKLLKLYIQEDQQLVQNPEKQTKDLITLSQSPIQQKAQESVIIELSKKFVQELSQNAMEKVLKEEELMVKSVVIDYIQGMNCRIVDDYIKEQQNMIKQISSNFIKDMNTKVIEKCIKEQEDMIKQLSSNFLKQTNKKAIQNIIKQQEKMINQIASSYKKETNKKIIENCVKNMKNEEIITKPHFKKTISLEDNQTKKFQVSQQQLEKMIDAKMKLLMPSIVEKVTKIVQKRFMKMSCVKCQKRQLSVQKLINKRLMEKCALKRCE